MPRKRRNSVVIPADVVLLLVEQMLEGKGRAAQAAAFNIIIAFGTLFNIRLLLASLYKQPRLDHSLKNLESFLAAVKRDEHFRAMVREWDIFLAQFERTASTLIHAEVLGLCRNISRLSAGRWFPDRIRDASLSLPVRVAELRQQVPLEIPADAWSRLECVFLDKVAFLEPSAAEFLAAHKKLRSFALKGIPDDDYGALDDREKPVSSNVAFGADTLAELALLPNLVDIHLDIPRDGGRHSLERQHFDPLSKWKGRTLRSLTLRNVMKRMDAVSLASCFTSLVTLELSWAQLEGDDLDRFTPPPSLRRLVLDNNSRLTSRSIVDLLARWRHSTSDTDDVHLLNVVGVARNGNGFLKAIAKKAGGWGVLKI